MTSMRSRRSRSCPSPELPIRCTIAKVAVSQLKPAARVWRGCGRAAAAERRQPARTVIRAGACLEAGCVAARSGEMPLSPAGHTEGGREALCIRSCGLVFRGWRQRRGRGAVHVYDLRREPGASAWRWSSGSIGSAHECVSSGQAPPVLLRGASTWVGVRHTHWLDDAIDGVARTIADRGLLCAVGALQGGAWGGACGPHA